MTDVNEWIYFCLIHLHISLVNNMHMCASYTRRMISLFHYTGHLIVHHIVYAISYFTVTYCFFSSFATASSPESGNVHTAGYCNF